MTPGVIGGMAAMMGAGILISKATGGGRYLTVYVQQCVSTESFCSPEGSLHKCCASTGYCLPHLGRRVSKNDQGLTVIDLSSK
eukprot:scaffold115002_cov22-Tisochrysis_lutea.AAC.1